MLYRGEIVVNGSVTHSQNYGKATHPNHVARLLISRVALTKEPYFIVFVANTDGDLWEYSFDNRRVPPRTTVTKIDTKLNAVQVSRLFSGTKSIMSSIA